MAIAAISARIALGGAAALCAATFGAAAAFAQDRALIERGAYLVNGVVACGNCHVARDPTGAPIAARGLSGGFVFDAPPFKAFASNITPDPETGIGRWTDEQLARAIREGIRPDGSVIGPPMPFGFYRGIADDDLAAIVAYLKAQPAVRNAVPKSEYRITLPPNYGPPITTKVVAPARSDTIKYGEYLAGPLGHCTECHTPWDKNGHPDMSQLGAGGNPFPGPWGVSVARNITPHETGLKGWSGNEIARAIRTGVRKDGSPLKPPMAYPWYANIDDADMNALVAYLQSLPPKPFAGKEPPK